MTNPPGIFNVGTGQGISVRQFVQACKDVTGAHILVTEEKEARQGDYAEVWKSRGTVKKFHDVYSECGCFTFLACVVITGS